MERTTAQLQSYSLSEGAAPSAGEGMRLTAPRREENVSR